MERDRQIVGADEHAVDAGRRQNGVERSQRLARLDHGDRQRHGVGAVQIGGTDETAQRQRGARPPGAGAQRGKLDELGEAARLRDVIDHRRDDRRRAGVDETTGEREIADRNARQRRLASERDGEDRVGRAEEIEAAMLQVERHRVEGLARQGVGDRRVVGADPGGCRRRVAPRGPAPVCRSPRLRSFSFLSRGREPRAARQRPGALRQARADVNAPGAPRLR